MKVTFYQIELINPMRTSVGLDPHVLDCPADQWEGIRHGCVYALQQIIPLSNVRVIHTTVESDAPGD